MLHTIHSRCLHHVRGRPTLGLFVLVGVLIAALLLSLGAHSGGTPQAATADLGLEFEMEALGGGGVCTTVGTTPTQKGDTACFVPPGQSMRVVLFDTIPSTLIGEVSGWQAAISWTSGLVGPGDPSSTNQIDINCPGIEATIAPYLATPHSAAASCEAPGMSFSEAEARIIAASFRLTCGNTVSQELVTMQVTSPSDQGTHITDTQGVSFADKDGSEVITINCVPLDIEFDMAVTFGGTPGGGSGCDTAASRPGPAPTAPDDAICTVLVNGSFTVEVRLTDPGVLSGAVRGIQAVIDWTSGVQGPGDFGTTKQVVIPDNSCRGFEVTATTFLGAARTAAAACVAFPPPFSDAEATGFRPQFELNCGPSPSQTQLRMRVNQADPQLSTSIVAGPAFADKDGSEVITIRCAQEAPGLPGVPVGGFSTDLDGGGLALEAARPSDGGAGFAIALGAVATVSAAVLAWAGWYARRRWLTVR